MANFITKHIPNTLTCCNLISGCIATKWALAGDAKMALLWIIVGAAFDFFDGMSARLIGVSSPIGKELDSLADDITFGVAPASIVYAQLASMTYPDELAAIQEYIPFFAFVIAAFSALRLAKFNLDERQTTGFIGMPTPANALFWGSLLVSHANFIESVSPYMVYAVLALICITSYLLIAETPMFALKFKRWGWKGNELRYSFIMLSAAIIIWLGAAQAFCIIIALYYIFSLVNNWHCKATKGNG